MGVAVRLIRDPDLCEQGHRRLRGVGPRLLSDPDLGEVDVFPDRHVGEEVE